MLLEQYTALRESVLNLQKDVEKANGGNSTAARRLRKGLKEIQTLAKQMRKDTLEVSTSAPALAPVAPAA